MACCNSGPIFGDRQDNPLILGLPNGDPAVFVRVLRATGAAQFGTSVWVSGTTVAHHIARGRIIPA